MLFEDDLTLPVEMGGLELAPVPVPGRVPEGLPVPDEQSPGTVVVVSASVVVVVDVTVTVDGSPGPPSPSVTTDKVTTLNA